MMPNTTDLSQILQLPTIPVSTLRQSHCGTYAQCRRKFAFKVRFGLSKGQHRSAPFVGQLFHLAHAARYRGCDELGVARSVEAAVQDYHTKILAWADESGQIDEAATLTARVEKDAALAQAMSFTHWQTFPFDSKNFEVVLIEEDLTAVVPTTGKPIGGRLDLVLRVKSSPEGLVISDHKTTSRGVGNYLSTVRFATQPRLYRILLEYNKGKYGFENLPVIGMLHDVVLKPTIRWKKGQEWEEYLGEVGDWYGARVGPLNDKGKPRWDHSDKAILWQREPPFQRLFTYFNEGLYPGDLMTKLRELDEASSGPVTLGDFPTTGQDSGQCMNSFGTCCEFLDLCGNDPPLWENIVSRKYLQNEVTQVEDTPQEEPHD